MSENKEISYKNEIIRKCIHLNSLSIPIVYSFISYELALTILIPLTVMSIILDLASKTENFLSKIFFKIFGSIMRSHEVDKKYTLNGATWVLISAIICIIIFPKVIMVAGFSILIISDASAALFGKKFGKHKLFTKSWEGTGAFIFSACIVVMVVGLLVSAPWTFFAFGALGAIVAGFAEAASSIMKLDDNLSIPLSFGLIMLGGNYLCAEFLYPVFTHLMV